MEHQEESEVHGDQGSMAKIEEEEQVENSPLACLAGWDNIWLDMLNQG